MEQDIKNLKMSLQATISLVYDLVNFGLQTAKLGPELDTLYEPYGAAAITLCSLVCCCCDVCIIGANLSLSSAEYSIHISHSHSNYTYHFCTPSILYCKKNLLRLWQILCLITAENFVQNYYVILMILKFYCHMLYIGCPLPIVAEWNS